jgi:ribonuclease P/MRP protein subunit RPP40
VQVQDRARDLRILVTADYKPAEQCLAAAKKARGELFRLRAALSCRRPEVFLPLYTSIVRPHLEYCVQAWAPYYSKDINCLEQVQRLATRMMVGMKGKNYNERLQCLGLFSLQRRRARGDLIETYKILKGITKVDFRNLFELAPNRSTRGHGLKLQKSHARLNKRAKFFTNRVVNMWNKLPMEVITCMGVDTFKRSLDYVWPSLFPELI